MEWVGGSLFAIYGAGANTLYHSLDKFDLIDSSYVVPEKNLALPVFLRRLGRVGDWLVHYVYTTAAKSQMIIVFFVGGWNGGYKSYQIA